MNKPMNLCISRTDIFAWVIDGTTKTVVDPLVLDSSFSVGARKISKIIGITVSQSLIIKISYIYIYLYTYYI